MIKDINADMFADMMISGANNLSNNKKEVNELNVFPVPDGDTGTNMSLTAAAVAKALKEYQAADTASAANTAANAALRGARGNSGVIMSQLLRGMAKELKGKSGCNANIFAAALKQGSDAAYRAVMNPTEGTLLTVAREAASGAVLCESDDVSEVLAAAVTRGNAALKKTTFMLETLKRAGVVDAGGRGWMYILEGMLYYLQNGKVIEMNDITENTEPKPAAAQPQNIKFGYCTEFIIEKSGKCSISAFKHSIERLGDCMLVIDGDDVIKVHIHTNHPGVIIENALKLGELINIKIDNMRHQHNSIINAEDVKDKETDIKNTDNSAPKKYGFAAVVPGEGFEELITDLGADRIIKGGQTMNPSTEDILKAAESINAENIFIFPNNKNIIMAAEQAAEISEKNITVIPSRTVPESVAAMLEFDESIPAEKNAEKMKDALGRVRTYQVTYAVRELEDKGIKKGDIMGIGQGDIIESGSDRYSVTKSLIRSALDDDTEFVTVYYGADEYKAEAEKISGELSEEFGDIEFSVKYGGQDVYYYIISAE